MRVLCVDRACELSRRDRDGCGLEQLGGRHPRAARERRLRAGERPPQGLHPRRGPHALDGGLECLPEDARGAAAEHGLRAGDDRGRQGPGDRGGPLPPLRFPSSERRADRQRPAAHRRGGVNRDPSRGRRGHLPLGDRQLPRRARHARAARHLHRDRGRPAGRAGGARRRGRLIARSHRRRGRRRRRPPRPDGA